MQEVQGKVVSGRLADVSKRPTGESEGEGGGAARD